MSATRDLLIEIGTEELPPKALRGLSQAFADGMDRALRAAGLVPETVYFYAAPRRLALRINALPTAQPDRETVRRGPALAAAFDEEGCPTQAAVGFAGSCGVSVEELDQLETPKGSWLSFRALEPGQNTSQLIPQILSKTLAALPIPKRMRWGAREDEFVRPVHWVVLLFGEEVIDAEILGVKSGRNTYGHRFMRPQALPLPDPEAYLPLLEQEGCVLADYQSRRERIRRQVIAQAQQLGGTALIDEALLDEVTALVEWPVALSGQFDRGFLKVPAQALISSMQDHQKYFPVVDDKGTLMARFIAVANLESKDPSQIKAGNERVIRPRLADAAFFWDQDRKRSLAQRRDDLRHMTFQKKLGSLYDKQERVAVLAARVAGAIGASAPQAERCARLCKCDLLTSMVYEFPELQGVMGRYYALHDGEDELVAEAIEQHYQPRFAGDELPQTGLAQAVALADRLDSLLGIFAIGQQPSGDKDPFALRRAALGVIRICVEGSLDVDLVELLRAAAAAYDGQLKAQAAIDDVVSYIMDRLRGYYQEQDVAIDLVDAVLATAPTRLLDIDRRIQACRAFRELPQAQSLAAANKRISNILRKNTAEVAPDVDPGLLREPAEQQLAAELNTLQAEVIPLMEAGDYRSALTRLAALRESVDGFFDGVMVMVDDDKLRANRLALLKSLGDLFLRVADLSRLQS